VREFVIAASILVLTAFYPASVAAQTPPDNNTLANFIAVKEMAHCAAFHIADLNARGLAKAERDRKIGISGRFVAAALQTDEALTATGLQHAQRYLSELPQDERVSRYRRKCAMLIDDSRFRTRMLDWRYRLNASLPVPPEFFEMRWEGPLPPQWYRHD